MKLAPKNWRDFQHYKDRSPPWIRLHRRLLDDREFQRLPLASRALAPMLWLLASESKDGVFDGSIEELSFRLRASEKEITSGLTPLIERGFFIDARDASTVLAVDQQVAPESRSEGEGEGEGETDTEAEAGAEPSPPPAISLPLNDGTEYPISQAMVNDWQTTYGAVNVMQELREMRVWSQANPSRRKTHRGIASFIVRWLSGEQDKGGKPKAQYGQSAIPTRHADSYEETQRLLADRNKSAAPIPAEVRQFVAQVTGKKAAA